MAALRRSDLGERRRLFPACPRTFAARSEMELPPVLRSFAGRGRSRTVRHSFTPRPVARLAAGTRLQLGGAASALLLLAHGSGLPLFQRLELGGAVAAPARPLLSPGLGRLVPGARRHARQGRRRRAGARVPHPGPGAVAVSVPDLVSRNGALGKQFAVGSADGRQLVDPVEDRIQKRLGHPLRCAGSRGRCRSPDQSDVPAVRRRRDRVSLRAHMAAPGERRRAARPVARIARLHRRRGRDIGLVVRRQAH